MVKQVLRYTGANVGLTSTSGVYVNGLLAASGDATGPRSARIVLRDPSVDVAVLETARGGILREGLAFTDSDVGVVLNVSADHLGLKGIETLEDLAALKSLVVETVHRSGTSVLNADDPLCVRMARRAGGRLAWFSLHGGPDEMPTFLRRHVEEGGLAVVREPGHEGGTIVAYERGRREVVIEAGAIPATLHGMATFNIANACATIAMCLAHKVPLITIRSGMASFQSTFEQNPGRLNVHDEHGFRVIPDYAHNAAGLRALGEVVRGLRHRYKRSLGVLSIPGDRREEDIIEMGEIAGGIFDELFFREDPGLRGRSRGEVMDLLGKGAVQGGALPERVHLIPTEHGATAAALLATNPGDLLIVTPTDVDGTWQQIERFQRPETPTSATAAA
jgi:cyanophycin synthetase